MPTFSIIIPTFNSSHTVRRCIDSVIGQSYKDWELLLMDGASKDDTVAIVNAYQDDRIHVFSEPDNGVYDAMNKGIDKSSGEWLYFLGSDDSLINDEVLEMVCGYLDESYHVVYGEVASTLPKEHCGEWGFATIRANRCHQAIFYNRSFFGASLRYDLKYRLLADYDINLRWFLRPGKYKYRYIPVSIANYTVGGLSSRNSDEIFYNDYIRLLLKYGRFSLSPKYKKQLWTCRLNMATNSFERFFCHSMLIWLFLLRKIEEVFGIDQNRLRE